MVKSISTDLASHLAQEVTTIARCWKIVRMDGTIFRFTSHDADLDVAGDGTYVSSAGFSNSAIENKSDLSVDNQDIQGVFDDDSITLLDLRAGAFDYADIYIFAVNWQDTTQGPLKMRRGKLGEVVSSPQGWFTVELRGMTQLLQQQVVELYGPTCRADLFDSRCALDKTNYISLGHVATITDQLNVVIVLDTLSSTYTASNAWFQYGTLQYLTGANAGKALEVKAWDHVANTIQFYVPAGYALTVGDTFKIIPGCDKSRGTCIATFNNILNMRAEPDLPGNDAAFIYPDLGAG